MKEGIKLWLSFTQGERNGAIVLIGILVVQLIVLNNMDWFVPKTKTDFTKFHEEIAKFKAAQAAAAKADSVKSIAKVEAFERETKAPKIEYFHFDPNTTKSSEWKALGLRDWQYKMIFKYLDKGGTFRQKQDLQKMYSIDEELYNKLEPWIDLPDSIPLKEMKQPKLWNTKETKRVPKPPIRVLVNSADTNQWQALRGIGPAYARRIVKYRNKLGGFRTKAQLNEVWGLPPEVIERVDAQLDWDTLAVRQLDINRLPADSLWTHPYISFNLARVIVAYREMHGPYKSVSEVKNTDLVDAEEYRKIAPYLKVN